MILTLKRVAKRERYTIGKLYADGKYLCDTIEDRDRSLYQSMSVAQIVSRKVYGETAIPYGKYEVRMDKPSPKYQKKAQTDAYFKPFCDHMPRIWDVKGWDGVLIHPGTDETSTLGCVIVGENKVVGKVINSRATFKKVYDVLIGAYRLGDKIELEII